MIDWKSIIVAIVSCLCFNLLVQHFNFVLDKNQYNELVQDKKPWAYVKKDTKL